MTNKKGTQKKRTACVRTNATLVLTHLVSACVYDQRIPHTFAFGARIEPKQSAYKQ